MTLQMLTLAIALTSIVLSLAGLWTGYLNAHYPGRSRFWRKDAES